MSNIVDFTQSRAEKLYKEGIYHEEQGRYTDAVAAFEQVVQLNPSHVEAHLGLAYSYQRLEQTEDALHHARIAVSLKPSARAHFILGHALLTKREFAAALDELRACLDLDPDFAEARYQIAFSYYLQGDYNVAITEFHRVAQRQPDWETLFFLGESYRLTMRPTEAERTFRRALGVTTNWTQVELTRGQLESALRLHEFPAAHTFTMKDRLYCDNGTVYLGTSLDDGVRIPPYLVHHFSNDDIARTLSRLLHLKAAHEWHWDSVWAVDTVSMPLAVAMARLFSLPFQPASGDRALVVQALGEQVLPLQETVAQTKAVNSFCLLSCWTDEWLADITGLLTPLTGSLPWYRVTTSADGTMPSVAIDSRPPEEIATELLETLVALPAEPNLTAQLDYYHRHSRLRWE